jgi:hypothetical protein
LAERCIDSDFGFGISFGFLVSDFGLWEPGYNEFMLAQFHSRFILGIVFTVAGCAGPSAPMQPAIQSGLQKGEDIIPWNPVHVAGPNAGTNACPVCTYGARPAIVVFARNDKEMLMLVTQLEDLVRRQSAMDLKAFVIVLDGTPDDLKSEAVSQGVKQIGFCYPDPATRDVDLKDYKINPSADNTVMIYKDYKVAANFVNLGYGDFNQVETAVANLR